MLYKYETHMHSSECSKCAKSSAADMVRAFHEAGYAGAVLTNHFIWGNTSVPQELPWEERMQLYYDAWLSAKPVAEELDFDLLFGIEHLYSHWREILIYGLPVEFWKENKDVPEIGVEELGERIHAAGGFISHAHPYRMRPRYMPEFHDPILTMCDAVEVFNFSEPDESNQRALALADENGLLKTSGADAHSVFAEGIGQSGMAFNRRLRTGTEFAAALRAGEGRLIVKGEIQ